ncbi:LysR family transcriptional regulator [Phyllobacterium leguminum]|uniref:DNA-binding transcriptional LysR family regulator n=1 Tax=Phyllobacterium leguminum TaxID=314237 RepID=A0A318T9K4_9HYPH|nr:LysR family transcriptional regulator [Phyllobacterium leguminum]PYE90354.1 DNA-binding transcriptional LysR family regulator [Phyllobacterium leguminum]
MKNESWSDLHLFLHVARQGGLTGAAERTGFSPATIGRRVLALEREMGRTLFTRRQTGYSLTKDGQALLEKVLAMDEAARSIAEWNEGAAEIPMVRISAGSWMSHFMAINLGHLWQPTDAFRICFKTAEARLDLSHREAEIGIRNRFPEGGNLAARPIGEVAYAPFCASHFNMVRDCNWVGIGSEDAITPSARWLLAQTDLWITIWANTPRTLHDLLRGGAGRGVLPCFVGDEDPALVRAGPPIEELRHKQWLVMHNDDRHRPEIRTLIERLAHLVDKHQPLFRGERARS